MTKAKINPIVFNPIFVQAWQQLTGQSLPSKATCEILENQLDYFDKSRINSPAQKVAYKTICDILQKEKTRQGQTGKTISSGGLVGVNQAEIHHLFEHANVLNNVVSNSTKLPEPEIDFVFCDKKVPQEAKDRIEKEIKHLLLFAQSLIPIPRKIKIDLLFEDNAPAFDPYYNVVRIPIHFENSMINGQQRLVFKSKTFEQTLPIIVHEIGHWVMSTFLTLCADTTQIMEAYKALEKDGEYLEDRIEETKKKCADLKLISENMSTSSTGKELKKTEDVLSDSLSEQMSEEEHTLIQLQIRKVRTLRYAKQFLRIERPLDELFSDLFACAYLKNGKAIYESVLFDHSKIQDKANAKYRDCTVGWPFHDWDQIKPHSFYSPMRGYVWKNYLSNTKNEFEQPVILNALLQANAKTIADKADLQILRQAKKPPKVKDVNPEKMNLDLKCMFDNQLEHIHDTQ